MNVQCELVSLLLYEWLNCVFVGSDTVAHTTGDLMTLPRLGCSFMSTVHHHHHFLHCSAVFAPATAAVNPFGSLTEFSCLVLALKGIFDVLHYQVC